MSTRYLRIVVTPRCSLACSYCHMEGDPASGDPGSVSFLAAVTRVAYAEGFDKFKLLGGEPLLRADLGALIGAMLATAPRADLSLITAGVAPKGRLEAAFAAGLDRANLSIHGWSFPAFEARTQRGIAAYQRREETLASLLGRGPTQRGSYGSGRVTKLNYVYTSAADEDDLGALLEWAAGQPVVVNVLDDLQDPKLGPAAVLAAVARLRGPPQRRWIEPDPSSLDTLHLGWADGLEVEVKHQQLGALAPWSACGSCPARTRCREGIHALRLTHDGWLRTCMDRPDLGVDLGAAWRRAGLPGLRAAWAALLDGSGTSTLREAA